MFSRSVFCRYPLVLLLLVLSTLPVLASVEVVDDLNHTVSLPLPAQRIISLAPHLTENLFAIGAGDLLVGVSRFSDFPQQAQSIQTIGDSQALNIELIVALEPDLVVAWVDGGNTAAVARLQSLGIPVYWSKPIKLKNIADEIRKLSTLVGRSEVGESEAAAFGDRLESLKPYVQANKVPVFYQVWNSPLQTLNRNTLINSLIELCGGENSFAQVKATVATVDAEQVLARNPAVILGSHAPGQEPTWVEFWQQWPFLRAVKNGHVYSLNANLIARHTVRVLDGAERMCQLIDSAREH